MSLSFTKVGVVFPVDTGRKLNVHKTFNLRLVSTGLGSVLQGQWINELFQGIKSDLIFFAGDTSLLASVFKDGLLTLQQLTYKIKI